jgi:hypothetical protein
MIAEALLYAATFPVTTKPHRPFIRSSVNLWSRAGRCRKAWAEHEARSKQAILDAMVGVKPRRTAVVLGSGLLRDVPIKALAKAFDTVVLVDLVHLASVRLRLRLGGYGNVRLIERDVSGYDDLASSRVPEPLGFLRQVPYLDFVVSANLLSQIGVGADRRSERVQAAGLTADASRMLIAAHLDGLKGLPCAVSLITDTAYRIIDREGRVDETADLLKGVAPPEALSSWTWPVVPIGEESRDYKIIHDVIAARMGVR